MIKKSEQVIVENEKVKIVIMENEKNRYIKYAHTKK